VTNEEFQKLVLEKLASLEQGQATTNAKIDTVLSEIKNLKETDQTLLDLVEKTYHETEKISQNQLIQGESVNILSVRQLQTEAEFAAWRKAR